MRRAWYVSVRNRMESLWGRVIRIDITMLQQGHFLPDAVEERRRKADPRMRMYGCRRDDLNIAVLLARLI